MVNRGILFAILSLSGALAYGQVKNSAYDNAVASNYYDVVQKRLTDEGVQALFNEFAVRRNLSPTEMDSYFSREQKEAAMKDFRPFFCAQFAPTEVRIDGVATQRFQVVDPKFLQCLTGFPETPWTVTQTEWTQAIEIEWREWLRKMGQSSCRTVDECLASSRSNFLRSEHDVLGIHYSDCADLPYYLRMYFSWKKGLPFSYVNSVSANPFTRHQELDYQKEIERIQNNLEMSDAQKSEALTKLQQGRNDARYSRNGNFPASRRLEPYDGGASQQFFWAADQMRNRVMTGMFRINQVTGRQIQPDFYSPIIRTSSIVPGTVLYKPTGHAAIVFDVDQEGNVRYMDAHPDNSLTRGTFNRQYISGRPSQAGGFKNWRPVRFENLTTTDKGLRWVRGQSRTVFSRDEEIADFSLEQYFGHLQKAPVAWTGREFCAVENGACRKTPGRNERNQVIIEADGNPLMDNVIPTLVNRVRVASGTGNEGTSTVSADWYAMGTYRPFDEFVKAQLKSVRRLGAVATFKSKLADVCGQLQARKAGVEAAIADGVDQKEMPANLPRNIFGAEGEWEVYSSPGRDINIRLMIVDLVGLTQELFEKWKKGDSLYQFDQGNFKEQLINEYHKMAGSCPVKYTNSQGREVTLSFAGALDRVVQMSFNPYLCVERRWGAQSLSELSSCQDQGQEADWARGETFFRETLTRDAQAVHGYDVNRLLELASKRPSFDRTQFNILQKLQELR
ncbi:MAG: hypothetical protein ACK5RO_09705 [Pseudobdellovibrionaceae bacterium]